MQERSVSSASLLVGVSWGPCNRPHHHSGLRPPEAWEPHTTNGPLKPLSCNTPAPTSFWVRSELLTKSENRQENLGGLVRLVLQLVVWNTTCLSDCEPLSNVLTVMMVYECEWSYCTCQVLYCLSRCFKGLRGLSLSVSPHLFETMLWNSAGIQEWNQMPASEKNRALGFENAKPN